jgi:hypothetical protein
MLVAGVRQPVAPAVRGHGLYSEATRLNSSNASQRESSFNGSLLKALALPW